MEPPLLTNHARVLLYLAVATSVRMTDIALAVGVTERSAHRIVAELVEGRYLTRHREGRRNFYEIHVDRPLRDPMGEGSTVGDFLLVLRNGRRGGQST